MRVPVSHFKCGKCCLLIKYEDALDKEFGCGQCVFDDWKAINITVINEITIED